MNKSIDFSLLKEMDKQSKLYKPTIFWEEASSLIIKEFQGKGLNNFRRLQSALWFFVPTYEVNANGLSKEVSDGLIALKEDKAITSKQRAFIDDILSGTQMAFADYRTFLAANLNKIPSPLLSFSESSVGNPIEHYEFDGKKYSRSALNYLLGLSFLSNHVDLASLKNILEIGGGFGTLGEITKKVLPQTKYIDIDIPPTLFASTYYLQEVFGCDYFTSVRQTEEDHYIDGFKPLTVLPSWEIEKLQGKVDLFVNFISFQEMEPEIVQNYLNHVVRLKTEWVLLRNMREGKQTRKQHKFGVDRPIYSEDYIKMLPGYELVDTNVVPFGFKTVDNFHSELMLFKRNVS